MINLVNENRTEKLFVATLLLIVATIIFLTLGGCASPADVASTNLSTAADNFQVNRRIIFINGITDKYLLQVEGLCSLGNFDTTGELTVTCKVGPDSYKKHFLGLSDNVTYVAEQLEPIPAGTYHYRAVFRPETILPDIKLDTSSSGE